MNKVQRKALKMIKRMKKLLYSKKLKPPEIQIWREEG